MCLKAAGGGCLGLAVLDVGAGGRPAILVTTTAGLVLLKPRPSGCSFTGKKLDAGKHIADGKLGAPARCLVGDFDNDGVPDVLQVFANGGLFYKATAPGAFAAAVPSPASSAGSSMASMCARISWPLQTSAIRANTSAGFTWTPWCTSPRCCNT